MSGLLEFHWERGKQFSLRFIFGQHTKYIETMPTDNELKQGKLIQYPQEMVDEYEERTASAWASLSERNLQRSNPIRFSGKRIINE